MSVDSEISQTTDVALGARVARDAVTFTVWAPRHDEMTLRLEDRDSRIAIDGVAAPRLFHGDGAGRSRGPALLVQVERRSSPDPVSRYQPEGVFGPSAIVDPASFPWTDADWTGAPPRHRNVVYEMHVGTFTTAGTWGRRARSCSAWRTWA
jgi:maltooligosyltrehalose trehalohydrolase